MNIYYRCVKGRGLIFDRLIRWYTHSDFTHVEFSYPLWEPNPKEYIGAQVSGGVAIRNYDYLKNVKFVGFKIENVADSKVISIQQFLESQIGKPYDIPAIIGFGTIIGPTATDRWFCSDLWFYALKYEGVEPFKIDLVNSDHVTPRDSAITPIASVYETGSFD